MSLPTLRGRHLHWVSWAGTSGDQFVWPVLDVYFEWHKLFIGCLCFFPHCREAKGDNLRSNCRCLNLGRKNQAAFSPFIEWIWRLFCTSTDVTLGSLSHLFQESCWRSREVVPLQYHSCVLSAAVGLVYFVLEQLVWRKHSVHRAMLKKTKTGIIHDQHYKTHLLIYQMLGWKQLKYSWNTVHSPFLLSAVSDK